MPKGYVLAEVEVTDPALFAEYGKQVPATVQAFGGRYIVRGGAAERMEGDHPMRRMVVLEFPSVEQAKAWYSCVAYAPLKDMRMRAATTQLIIMAGTEP